MGQLPHQPTDKTRQKVRAMAAVGVPQDQIALALRIDPTTLRKHYRQDIDIAVAEATAQVGGQLFKLAMGGDTVACIFWMKARAGWIDRPQTVNHNHLHVGGGTMSHEERLALLERGPDPGRKVIEGSVEVEAPERSAPVSDDAGDAGFVLDFGRTRALASGGGG